MQPSHPWADAPPPSPRLRICVVVPVRNEAASLAQTLDALATQRDRSGKPLDPQRFEVLLLANNCSDDSAAVARAAARRHPDLALHVAELTLAPAQSNIGHVRRVLMDAAAERLQHAGRRAIIASTDGDTTVAPDWLARTRQEINAGADAVGGRINIDPRDDADPLLRRWRRWDTAYKLACERLASLLDPEPADPWPRHHQHFCGSLAVTRAAYLRVGGVPSVAFLEDEALVAALRLQDLRVRHSPLVRVCTSGRQDGRAEVGLAWQLRQWAEQGAQGSGMLVEDAPVLAARLAARRQLRVLHGLRGSQHDGAARDARTQRLAHRWQMSGQQLVEHIAGATSFGALWAWLEATGNAALPPAAVVPPPLVPVAQALAHLRLLIHRHAQARPLASREVVAAAPGNRPALQTALPRSRPAAAAPAAAGMGWR